MTRGFPLVHTDAMHSSAQARDLEIPHQSDSLANKAWISDPALACLALWVVLSATSPMPFPLLVRVTGVRGSRLRTARAGREAGAGRPSFPLDETNHTFAAF